jgi:DivIVA domain-containing protein
MNDDSFHLTPIDIRHQTFARVMRGYDIAAVEDFKLRVAEEMERLSRSNQDLEAKARGFHEQLRAFRERDKALNDALVSAQQLRSEIREQAERESQLILREARAEGDRMLEATRTEIRRLAEQIEQLDRVRRAYLSQLRAMIERQLSEIAAAEATGPPAGPPPSSSEAQDAARRSQNTPAWLDSLVRE